MLSRIQWLVRDLGYRQWVVNRILTMAAGMAGYSLEQWGRVAYLEDWHRHLHEMGPGTKDALEISPGKRTDWRDFGFRSYRAVEFPEFDICRDVLAERFDIIIADNVFEHVPRPWVAVKNVFAMLQPGGQFLVITPFLVRIHAAPNDYTRWTPAGLRELLEEGGFRGENIRVHAWGNRACVVANLRGWRSYGWGRSRVNEPDLPTAVWAFASKP